MIVHTRIRNLYYFGFLNQFISKYYSKSEKGRFKEIMDFVRNKPRSQIEILNEFYDGDVNKFANVKKHLDRGQRLRIVAYLKRNPAGLTILKEYLGVEWIKGTHRYYVHIPETHRLYKKLMKMYSLGRKNVNLIKEITKLHRLIEIAGWEEELAMTNERVIRADLRESKRKIPIREVKELIKQNRKNFERFYKKRLRIKFNFPKFILNGEEYFNVEGIPVKPEREIEFLSIIKMPLFMHCVAFHIPKVPHYAEDNTNKSVYETYTFPMLEKMRELFIEIVRDSQMKA